MQKESFLLRACSFITRYSIYALVFLIPIFFLPWTTDVLDFNKQAVLLLLVFLSLFALMIKILVSGKFEINKSPMHILAGVLFIIYLFATVFSIYRYGSFWGQSQQISESMLTVTSFLLLYFLISNIFTKKDILTSVIVLSFSAVVAELIGVLQLFGLFIIPFDFTKSVAFNTIGSAGSLGFFAAILLPLSILLLIVVKKWWKALFIVELVLSASILLLVNYAIIWWVVIAGSALILILGVMKRNIVDGRWLALPMFFLAISLFFVLLNLQLNWAPQRANEVFLSQKTGLSIGLQAVREKPIFGSGPGTFAYDFSKFKSPDFAGSSIWNVTFGKSSSKVLNNLATTGIIGFLAMLAFMVFPIFYGIKSIVAKKDSAPDGSSGQIYNVLFLGLFIAIVEQTIVYFLYNSNIVLDFIYFFTIAALIGLISDNKKSWVLKPSSLLTLSITFAFTLVFIFGMGVLILNGQRYLAEADYYGGLADYQSGQQLDEGLKKLESAASLNPKSDLYFRQLSQAYLLSLQNELKDTTTTPTEDQKTKVQNLISNAINAGKISTDLNSQDVNNWSSRGYIYQNLLGVSSDSAKWAIDSYDSAIKLDPNNPYLFAQEGNVYLAEALNPPTTGDQKNQLLSQARTQLEKAVSLNANYSNALYSLGIVYDSLSQKDKAIGAFTTLQQLNPTNTDISNALSNLKAGKSLVQSATPPAETPPSEASGTVQNPPATDKTGGN